MSTSVAIVVMPSGMLCSVVALYNSDLLNSLKDKKEFGVRPAMLPALKGQCRLVLILAFKVAHFVKVM